MRKIDYWFLIPTVVVMLVVVALPLAQVFSHSFTDAKLFGKKTQIVGLDNYVTVEIEDLLDSVSGWREKK